MLIPNIIKDNVQYINVDHSRDFIHVDDLCNAVMMLMIDKNEYVMDIGTGYTQIN